MSMSKFRYPGKPGFYSSEQITRFNEEKKQQPEEARRVLVSLAESEQRARNSFIQDIEKMFQKHEDDFIDSQFKIVMKVLKTFKLGGAETYEEDVRILGGAIERAPDDFDDTMIVVPKHMEKKSLEEQDEYKVLYRQYVEITGLTPHWRYGIDGLTKELAKVGYIVQNKDEEVVDAKDEGLEVSDDTESISPQE